MTQDTPRPVPNDHRRADTCDVGWVATPALLSVSCCILTMGLSMIDLGRGWLALFGPFVVDRGAVLGAVGLALIWATVRLVRGPPRRGRRMGTVLTPGFAMVAIFAAATAPVRSAQTQRALWAFNQERRS